MAHIGKLRFNWRGVWVSGTNYKPDDMVQYKGQTYICNANTSSTTSPQDRVTTNSDNPGSAGTEWTLYSHSGLGGDANRGETGYKSSNTFMFGTDRSSHGHLTNSYWRSGTYYHGDNVQYIANNGVSGTYRVNVASTTLPPANTTANPTTDWDRIAFGTASPNKTALVHPDCAEPFPNSGYILRSQWSGNNMVGNSTPAWFGDTYGYGVTDSTQYFMGGCCFINKNFLPVTIPGDAANATAGSPPFEQVDNFWTTSEVPFRHLDYLDGVLDTPDGEPPKVSMLLKDYAGMFVLFNNGEVHYYGANTKGQAGRGTTTDTEQNGAFNRWGYANVNRTGETKVLRGKKAIRIAMTLGNATNTDTATYALISYGANNTNEIWHSGDNHYGQGAAAGSVDNTVPTHITTGANGWDQAAFGNPVDIWANGGTYGRIWVLTDTGKMYACGYNVHGQLGVGDLVSKPVWTLVKDWGTVGGIKKFATAGNQRNVAAVVAGNGTLWTWGENAAGALGQGDTSVRSSPTQVGSDTDWQNVWVFGGSGTGTGDHVTFATKGTSQTDNDLYACGDGANYVLGQGNATDQQSFVQPLDSYGATISNIVNVKAITGTGAVHIGIGLEQYIADTSITNQNGYKTRWYFQGDQYGNVFELGSAASPTTNTLDADLPKPSASATEQYYYHQNLRVFPGVNPYRISLQTRGYTQATSAAIYFDKDVGRVIATGATYYGLDNYSAPGDFPTQGTDIETKGGTVFLPGN